jgi:hypothetical protein
MKIHDQTRHDQTRPDKTTHAKTRQDKTRQDMTRQDKTRQDKTRQDKTRQNRDDAYNDCCKLALLISPSFLPSHPSGPPTHPTHTTGQTGSGRVVTELFLAHLDSLRCGACVWIFGPIFQPLERSLMLAHEADMPHY